jgi:hypothetical protein
MAITRSSTSFEILNCLQRYLSNIDSINTVQVNDIQHGWAVTFLSEVGDLPLMEVTKGRLTGPQDFDLTVSEYIKGDVASLVFDGSDRPTEKVFTVTNLISGGRCKSWRPVVLLSISTRLSSIRGTVYPYIVRSISRNLQNKFSKRGVRRYSSGCQCGRVEAIFRETWWSMECAMT